MALPLALGLYHGILLCLLLGLDGCSTSSKSWLTQNAILHEAYAPLPIVQDIGILHKAHGLELAQGDGSSHTPTMVHPAGKITPFLSDRVL